MITFQLMLIAATLGAIPTITRLVRAIVRLIATLVASAVTVGFALLLLVAIASHGKLI